jgi:hypothetical protein
MYFVYLNQWCLYCKLNMHMFGDTCSNTEHNLLRVLLIWSLSTQFCRNNSPIAPSSRLDIGHTSVCSQVKFYNWSLFLVVLVSISFNISFQINNTLRRLCSVLRDRSYITVKCVSRSLVLYVCFVVVVCPFVLFLLAIVFSVLLRYTESAPLVSWNSSSRTVARSWVQKDKQRSTKHTYKTKDRVKEPH